MNTRGHILFVSIVLAIAGSCRERACTAVSCVCKRPGLYFLIEREKFGDNPIDFEQEDLEHFYFLQLMPPFDDKIDSAKISFMKIGGDKHYYLFELDEVTFGDSIDLRPYNFRIVNRPINLVDSITEINYYFEDTTFLCNHCTPPPDDYVTCPEVRDLHFQFNGELKMIPNSDYYYTGAVLVTP